MSKNKKEAGAINSDAFNYLLSLINPNLKVHDLFVRGKWLVAELSSGVTFSVKNKRV